MTGSAATLPPAALTCCSLCTNCSTVLRTVLARGEPAAVAAWTDPGSDCWGRGEEGREGEKEGGREGKEGKKERGREGGKERGGKV